MTSRRAFVRDPAGLGRGRSCVTLGSLGRGSPQVVHYEQDVFVHRPLAGGMRVRSSATPVALLGRPNGTSLITRTATRMEDGTLANE